MPRGAFFHDLPPVFHSGLRGLQKTPVLFAFQQWNQLAQSIAAVANQSDLYCISQSYAFGIEFDLNAPSLVWFRHELDIRERGTDYQQRVAILHCLLRGLGAEKANSASRVRTIVGHCRFAEQRLHDWSCQQFRRLLEFVGRVERSSSGQDRDLLSTVQDLGSLLK